MFYRVARPVKRVGSAEHQIVKRIPANMKGRVDRLKLAIPPAGGTIHLQLRIGIK